MQPGCTLPYNETKGLNCKGNPRKDQKGYILPCLGLSLRKWAHITSTGMHAAPGIDSQGPISRHDNPTTFLRGACSGFGDSDFISLATGVQTLGCQVRWPHLAPVDWLIWKGASPPGMLGQGVQEHKGISQNCEPAKGVPPFRPVETGICFGMLASERHSGSLSASLSRPISFAGNRAVTIGHWAAACVNVNN